MNEIAPGVIEYGPAGQVDNRVKSVTMRQARLALLGIDKLAAVEAVINGLPEPDRTAARIWWEYSGTVERANPLVNAIGGAVGLDAEALDALFTAAASL